jgi:hypothetical protein
VSLERGFLEGRGDTKEEGVKTLEKEKQRRKKVDEEQEVKMVQLEEEVRWMEGVEGLEELEEEVRRMEEASSKTVTKAGRQEEKEEVDRWLGNWCPRWRCGRSRKSGGMGWMVSFERCWS